MTSTLEQELRAAAEKATQGEWNGDGGSVQVRGRGIIARCPTPQENGVMECVANKAFIAACCPANILALLDRLEKLTTAMGKIFEAHDDYVYHNPHAKEMPDWLDDVINEARALEAPHA